jgi:hypothetical protein
MSPPAARRLLYLPHRINEMRRSRRKMIPRQTESFVKEWSKAMPAITQWDNRKTRRNEFKKDDSAPSLREIRCNTAAVRENWSRGERQFRAQMAQLLQQQLLDRMASVPLDACEKAALREASLA